MRKGIVDRITDGWVQVEWEDRTMDSLPVLAFATLPAEGDLFVWEEERGRVLPDETKERRERMQKLFDRLKKE